MVGVALLKHHPFIRGRVFSNRFRLSLLPVVRLFRYVMSKKSDICESEEVRSAATLLVKTMYGIIGRKLKMVWDTTLQVYRT